MSNTVTVDFQDLYLFKQFIKEIDSSLIGPDYIQYILVTFTDHSDVKLYADDILSDVASMCVKRNTSKWSKELPEIESVRAYIDVKRVCYDVMFMYDEYIESHFSDRL
jgi:hypothetical protein